MVSSELKMSLQKKVLFSRTDFFLWELLLIKKLIFEKTNPTYYIFQGYELKVKGWDISEGIFNLVPSSTNWTNPFTFYFRLKR